MRVNKKQLRRVRRIRNAKKQAPQNTPSNRRRLMPTAAAVAGALAVAKGVKNYRTRKWKTANRRASILATQRELNSDNITTLSAFKIGNAKQPSFEEKVARITNPPQIFKRNYQWSSEVSSGRKGWFGIPINHLNPNYSAVGGCLYDDIMVTAGRLTTDTSTPDATVVTGQVHNSQTRFYVDYMSEKLQMINSSSNSITGKLKLWSYKRDAELTFTNQAVPMTPINLMMYSSTGALMNLYPAQEATVGNGWNFNSSTAGVNYTSNYDMPGSQQNPGGATAQTDLALDVLSEHIKEFTGYFFKEIASQAFSLKPGQQVNHHTIFNDLPIIYRQSLDQAYVAGTSYYLTVEFQAGIVGDATVTSGDNVISTGSGQLSCILVEKRIIGQMQRQKTKVIMPTNPLAGIAKASQFIINPDTGAGQIGEAEDV